MILKRHAIVVTAACGLSLVLTSQAAAADVSVNNTGAGSNQTVVIDNSSESTVTTTNSVVVRNENYQTAKTGDVSAQKNTSVGGAVQSGNAVNSTTTATEVEVANVSTPTVPAGGGGSMTPAPGASQPGGNSTGAGSAGGSVLGAAVGGQGGALAILPAVGASIPMDVSALRAAWQSHAQAPSETLSKGSQLFTSAMLLTATLLSLLGALGSSWYAKRREERV